MMFALQFLLMASAGSKKGSVAEGSDGHTWYRKSDGGDWWACLSSEETNVHSCASDPWDQLRCGLIYMQALFGRAQLNLWWTLTAQLLTRS